MLLKLFKNLFLERRPDSRTTTDELLAAVDALREKGDFRSAIIEYNKYLDIHPDNVDVLNNLGTCYADIGNQAAASAIFERAYSINDSNPAVIINRAKCLNDEYRSAESFVYLQQAKIAIPEHPHVDAVCSSLALARGDAALARKHALQAWLASFDNLRFANCYLFFSSYDDMDEADLATEHRFWAETRLAYVGAETEASPPVSALNATKKKLRIGYWSPDFRTHSVRYFARPLLENHDKEKFEIFVYHDFTNSDEQTEHIKQCADFFFDVFKLGDREFLELIRSHDLDILVELAGHSSANRIPLLKEQLAHLQLTGLGYPPTTGLSSIDGKILDVHVVDAERGGYYTETPLVLPHSFWCFDPKETPTVNSTPPAEKNGYVTFGCVGNIAKINTRIIICWKNILDRIPSSKLLLRSINFRDLSIEAIVRKRLESSGIDSKRVTILPPAIGADFFDSYNEIDIILDTYPFNGGTTTCFATYMGVPVISLSGESLLSRMGQSILTNLGMADWVVKTEFYYVERAVAAAKDIESLRKFRTEARTRYAETALGNGAIFAQDFETACIQMLEEKQSGALFPQHAVCALPAQDMVIRAYTVLRHGNDAAAQRIIDHCLKEYPDCGAAHILNTLSLTKGGAFGQAADYLLDRLSAFSQNDRIAALITITRLCIQNKDLVKANTAIAEAEALQPHDHADLLQIRMLSGRLQVSHPETNREAPEFSTGSNRFKVIIPCDDEDLFTKICDQISLIAEFGNTHVEYTRCPENRKIPAYNKHLLNTDFDFVILVQKNIEVWSPSFFADIVESLNHNDIVGFSGCSRWLLMNWRLDNAQYKASSMMKISNEVAGQYELQTSGENLARLVSGMRVLDGSLLAIRRGAFDKIKSPEWDPFLESSGALLEECFSHDCAKEGLRLAVHQNLGVVWDWRIPLQCEHLTEARWHISQKYKIQAFVDVKEERNLIAAPVETPRQGVRVLNLYLQGVA